MTTAKLTPKVTFLTTLLAEVHATFTPFRKLPQSALVTLSEERCRYERSGTRWKIGGNSAERQANKRLIESLERDKLIAVSRAGHRIRVRFTEAGYVLVSCLASQYLVEDAEPWSILSGIAEHVRQSECFGGMYVEERSLVGLPYTAPNIQDAILSLEQQALPLLCNNLIGTNADCGGRVGYHTTPEGRALLAVGKPKLPSDLPESLPAAVKLYNATYLDHLARRETLQPARENQVWIGLSAGLGFVGPALPRTMLAKQLQNDSTSDNHKSKGAHRGKKV